MPIQTGTTTPTRSNFCSLFVVVALLTSCYASTAIAQQPTADRAVPRLAYFQAKQIFYTGEYRDSLRAFRTAANGGVRSTEGRWVDSICYHTMLGESYYQMGELALALEQYEAALKLVLAHKNWMLRVQFPPDIAADQGRARARISWGASARRSQLGRFPDTMVSFQGQLDNENVVRNGGVVTPPQFFPLRVTEIVRCTGVALRRYAELMGPAGKYAPLSKELVAAFSTRPAPANHWSQVWVEAELGLAQIAAGNRADAIAHLQRSAVIGGDLDHPLTPIVLLELGKLFLDDNRLEPASNFFLEASFSAAEFGQPEIIDEALHHGLIAHIAAGGKVAYAPLVLAAPWAKNRRLDALEASLNLLACESYAAVGDTRRAEAMLDTARRSIGRADMRTGKIGARYEYQHAFIEFQKGNGNTGTEALAKAMAFQTKASPWLIHITLADRMYTTGVISPRLAKDLFELLLRDPNAADWAKHPMDAMAVTLSPLTLPMEHWFESALRRKEPELAMEISDRIRRRRFLSAMPLGGRLLSLRWIMEAPKASLSELALLQRQDLLAKYPKYAELKMLADNLRTQLDNMPLVPDDPREFQTQRKLLEELRKVSVIQEALLGEIAVRRQGAEIAFPPIRTTDEIRAGIPDGTIVVSYFNTSRYVYAFIFSNQKYAYWQVESPTKITQGIVTMLKDMGHYEGNQAISSEQLADDSWKQPAGELMQLLFNNADGKFWSAYDELVVVPDGPLWYLPFEALQVKTPRGEAPLISKVRIRYAPTTALTMPDDRGRKVKPRTLVVPGRLFPRDSESISEMNAAEIREQLAESSVPGKQLPAATGVFTSLLDRLIVLDDIADSGRGVFNWSPVQVDSGKPGSTLADWFPLPWGGPEEVVLPGYHTVAETGLRKAGTGNELFLTTLGLMSTGTRTILISRWRTGGQTAIELTREFLQELPRSAASHAWRRSVLLSRENEIDPELEPRINFKAKEDFLKSQHPFFWAGYMLVDTGSVPHREPDKGKGLRIEIRRAP